MPEPPATPDAPGLPPAGQTPPDHQLPEPDGPGWTDPPGEQLDATALEAATAWVEANYTLAVLGAFATGVFLGVMMRR